MVACAHWHRVSGHVHGSVWLLAELPDTTRQADAKPGGGHCRPGPPANCRATPWRMLASAVCSCFISVVLAAAARQEMMGGSPFLEWSAVGLPFVRHPATPRTE